jgi:hypothetical protein
MEMCEGSCAVSVVLCGALAKFGKGRTWMQREWEARVNFEFTALGGVNSPQLGMSQIGIWFPFYDLSRL